MNIQYLYTLFHSLATKFYWWLVVLILALRTLITGAKIAPGYFRLSKNPFITYTDIGPGNFGQESILLPVFAFIAHLNTRFAFYFFCLGTIYLAYIIFAAFVVRRFDRLVALGMTALLVGHPTSMVLFFWVGMPDALAFLFQVLALFVTNSWIIFGITVLGALNHPITIFSIPAVLLLRAVTEHTAVTCRHVGIAVLGSLVGFGFERLFLWYFGITVFSRLDFILLHDLNYWIHFNTSNFAEAIFSFHSFFVVVLIVCLVFCFRRNPRYGILWSLIALFFYGITFFTADTTRVYALLAWAPAFHCVMYAYELYQQEHPNSKSVALLLSIAGITTIFLPGFLVLTGTLYPTPFTGFFEKVILPFLKQSLQGL